MSADTENEADGNVAALGAVALLLIPAVGIGAWLVSLMSLGRYCGENNPYGLGGIVWRACNRFDDFGLFVPMFGPTVIVAAASVVALQRQRWRPLLIGCALALLLIAMPVVLLVIAGNQQGPVQPG